jgi:hypothetical protein
VKSTKEDRSWVADAPGKVVKMVYKLLYHPPGEGNEYRVVFMCRNWDEVWASQDKMLERLGNTGWALPHEHMKQLYEHQRAMFCKWVATKPCFKLMDINYQDVVNDSVSQAAKLDRSLGGDMDTEGMGAAVASSLFRQRK